MKRLIATLFALTMVCSLSACTSGEISIESEKETESSSIVDSSSNESKEENTEVQTEEEKSEFEFAIKSTSLSKNYDDSDVLVIEYDFTNNSKKATSFTFACQDTVFQDGVECDSTSVICDDIDTQQQLNDIQPGKTYTLKVGYKIANVSKPVDVVITDLYGQETLLEQTIELS